MQKSIVLAKKWEFTFTEALHWVFWYANRKCCIKMSVL